MPGITARNTLQQ